MRQFKQRVPSVILLAMSILFLVLVASGVYGFIYVPQDGIRIYHIALVSIVSFFFFIYSRRKILMRVDEVKHELSILENNKLILDAKIESSQININFASAKYNISEYRIENVSKLYRYNFIMPKSKELIFSRIFLKEISK